MSLSSVTDFQALVAGHSVSFYALADGVLDVKNYHGLGVGIALAPFVG